MIISGIRTTTLQYGADFVFAGTHAQVNGLATSVPTVVLGPSTESTVPFACVARQLTWESASGTATTRMRLVINGVAGADILLTGVEGSVEINVPIPAQAQAALEFEGTNPPNDSTWIVQCIGG